jgi:hypothetical protein
MRSLLLMFLLMPLIVFFGCSAEAPRATRPMFKGVELYSWVDPDTRNWRFALLPGTNRDKTSSEILTAPDRAQSVGELRTRISSYAQGEQIFWLVPQGSNFALPPHATVNDIISHAAAIGVSIQVLRR